MVEPCKSVAEQLNATLINMRFIKPIDVQAVLEAAEHHDLLVTVEENAIMGGAGSAVIETLTVNKKAISCLQLGLPDEYINHAKPARMLQSIGLDSEGILKAIQQRL
jgi:1-deoxy-D-xylulose-5-phosphate synthase